MGEKEKRKRILIDLSEEDYEFIKEQSENAGSTKRTAETLLTAVIKYSKAEKKEKKKNFNLITFTRNLLSKIK